LSSKINQLKFSERCHGFRTSVTISGNFFQRYCQLSYQNQEVEEKLWLPSGMPSEVRDVVFNVAAKFPMKRMEPGVQYQGSPLDAEGFVKQIERELGVG
jgi:hypothetical protein